MFALLVNIPYEKRYENNHKEAKNYQRNRCFWRRIRLRIAALLFRQRIYYSAIFHCFVLFWMNIPTIVVIIWDSWIIWCYRTNWVHWCWIDWLLWIWIYRLDRIWIYRCWVVWLNWLTWWCTWSCNFSPVIFDFVCKPYSILMEV